ncbi:MAG: enoyl-CoA hydratase/isomerase family protein [Bacteroidetes bacterium]|nr:enoyl-CoA hydratase/isomerase family protein [Bacteroidota bacterium]
MFGRDFSKFLITISKFPKPLVAAITGHSPAGGCIIGICCDYRVMAKGNYKIGLNEIPVGIIVPKGIMALYSRCIGALSISIFNGGQIDGWQPCTFYWIGG